MSGLASGSTLVSSAVLTTDDLTDTVDARLWYADTSTGHLYQRETLEGDSPLANAWTDIGLLAPAPGGGDGLAPLPVSDLTAVSIYTQQDDGTSMPVIAAEWSLLAATDILGYELEWQAGTYPVDPEDPGAAPVYDPPDFLNPQSRRVGRDQDSAILEPVFGGRTYDVRIRGYDSEATVGPWTTYSEVVILPDADAPAIPSPSAYAGYRMLGVRWDRNTEPDFDHYEVRYRRVGRPDWAYLETRSTHIVIGDLEPADWEAQVRALDASRNVQTSAIDPTASRPGDVAYPEAGWSVSAVAAPTLVGQSDIVFDNAIIEGILDAGTINADYITSGDLKVGGDGNSDGIRVYDSLGRPIGAWGDFGWLIADPASPGRAIWGTPQGEMRFSSGYQWAGLDPIESGIPTTTWTTAISASGINAEAITFGSVGGGHNKMLNAGIELVGFTTAAVSVKEWTVTADWATATNQVNLSTGTGDLKMAAI